jgi:carbohydrate kinase (thermoresistant glucokinase family)
MSRGIALRDEDRASWLLSIEKILGQNDQIGKSTALACSALKDSDRDLLKINDNVNFVCLQGTYEQIEDRLNNRADHYMSAKMLASQFDILEEPQDTLTIDITQTPQEIITIIRKGFNL